MKNEVTKPSKSREDLPLAIPNVDIYENDEQALVIAELPGVEQSAVDVQLEKGVLTIRATSADTRFERSFRVERSVDTDSIAAQYSNGLLRVRLPLCKPKAQRIQIKAA
jgi:HSP20 family molecular chaperone IbpA